MCGAGGRHTCVRVFVFVCALQVDGLIMCVCVCVCMGARVCACVCVPGGRVVSRHHGGGDGGW